MFLSTERQPTSWLNEWLGTTVAPIGVLAYLYEHGKGVPLDYVTAYMWYEAAASEGERRATERLRDLSKVMTKEQISRAKTLVRKLPASIHTRDMVEQSQRIGSAFNREP